MKISMHEFYELQEFGKYKGSIKISENERAYDLLVNSGLAGIFIELV